MPCDIVTIAGMPKIWSSDILFLTSSVAASFAKYAVAQSPYTVPENLSEAIIEVDKFAQSWGDEVITLNGDDIRKRLENFFENTPVIEAWNHPKSGNERAFYSGDRYGSHQKPDDDIIDLGALAQNISHDLVLSNVYDDAHETQRETI